MIIGQSEWDCFEQLQLTWWDDFIKLQFISHCFLVILNFKAEGAVIFNKTELQVHSAIKRFIKNGIFVCVYF